MCGYATGLAPKLFFTPVVNFLLSLYPSREVESRQATISASADPTPVQATQADLNPDEVTRVKGIGVPIRSVPFLPMNFEGSLDEGRSSRFGEPG